MNSSKETLQQKLKIETAESAFKYLIELGRNHSKVRETAYTDLKGMSYFSDNRFSPDLSNLLFKFRTRMFNVGNNFRNNYKQQSILCPVCEDGEDNFGLVSIAERCHLLTRIISPGRKPYTMLRSYSILRK